MELRELGATGLKVPEIGLGTWEYTGGVGPLRAGIELGATLIDTAEAYETEEVVGEAIRGMPREAVFIATKVSPHHLSYDDVLAAADRSLQRLGVDRLDLYQIHAPNPNVPIEETMRAMEHLADSGKIRFIGVSNFNVQQLISAQTALSKHSIVSNQVRYSLLARGAEGELLPHCLQRSITLIAYSPLARGRLVSKPVLVLSRSLRLRKGLPLLSRIARETGRSMAQVSLNWCLSRPGILVIPKTNSVERVRDLCEASSWKLSETQTQRLETAFATGLG